MGNNIILVAYRNIVQCHFSKISLGNFKSVFLTSFLVGSKTSGFQ